MIKKSIKKKKKFKIIFGHVMQQSVNNRRFELILKKNQLRKRRKNKNNWIEEEMLPFHYADNTRAHPEHLLHPERYWKIGARIYIT